MIGTRTRGFTLIELVVVITILGILAAFAVPKFITLDSNARAATVSGLAGTVRSAAALARGLSMASGSSSSVTMEGATVALVNNYPDGTANGIGNAINTSGATDFTFTPGSSSSVATWVKVGAPAATSATCEVTYTPASAAGFAPVVSAPTTGC